MRINSLIRSSSLSLVFLLTALQLSSQNDKQIDQRISQAFGKDYTAMLQKNNPDLLSYYQFYLNNAWQEIDLPAKKTKNLKTLELLPGKKEGSLFNLLLYNVERNYDRPTYYLHKGKVIQLISEQDLMLLYNEKVRNLNKEGSTQ